jgi:hypothetical protein
METVTAQEALAAMAGFSESNFLEKQVMVACQTWGEHSAVEAAASHSLRNGFVKKYVTSKKTGEMAISIEFRKPPQIEVGLPIPR